ncbi:MAG: glycosyltransferase [Victivallales bacterium]|jgi:GT2 family glycosyltransferase|nr:glycosyltransferase [Victivallales bacterium]
MKLTRVPILSYWAKYMLSPIRHYVLTGAAEKRNPNGYFVTREFLMQNPEAIAESTNPFYLYLTQHTDYSLAKKKEKKDYELLRKSSLFDANYYLKYNPSVRRKGTDPVLHFLRTGWREGRNPSAEFDMQYYLELNADLIKKGKVKNPLLHYLRRGIREKRRIFPAVFPRGMPFEVIMHVFRLANITKLTAATPRMPGKILVVIHLFYEDMLPEFIGYLKNIPYEFDIAISLKEQSSCQADNVLKAALPNCRNVRLVHAKNFGRDIGPFMVEFATIAKDYDYICKIHTKRDLNAVGAGWRTHALRNMLGSEQLVRNILAEFEKNASTGMIYPRPPLVALRAIKNRGAWAANYGASCKVGQRMGMDFSDVTNFDFPAGSMFWVRRRALEKLLSLQFTYDDFKQTTGSDGTLPHVMERLFGLIPVLEGFSLKSVFIYPPIPENPPEQYTPLDEDTHLKRIREYKARRRADNRIAVYTAMVGGYDSIATPEELDPEIDYICFSDSILSGEHPWEMRVLDYFNVDPTRISRYYKLHPHAYFSKYDYVIWVDSNILLRRNVIHNLIDTYKKGGNPLATIRHPERNCTYLEARICGEIHRLDDRQVIETQIKRYREEGLPELYGLAETNIYVTSPNDPRSIALFADWWKELENHSRCDQISLMYVLYKNGFSYTPLFDNYEEGPRHNARDFIYFMHKNHENLLNPSIYRYPSFIHERKRTVTDDLTNRQAALVFDDPRIDIIIAVHNALSDLKKCLDSLMPTLGRNQNVIIVNDGSDPETTDFLTSFIVERAEKIRLISHDTALGYTVSINEAIRHSSADYLIFLNSDTIVPSNWWRKLLNCAESSPDIGIVGPLSNAASYQSLPILKRNSDYVVNVLPEGVSVEDADRSCEELARPGFYPKCQLINGFCFFVKRGVFDRIGLFDGETFPIGYGEEDDFSLRAVEAGFIAAIATDTYVYHAKSKSFGHETRRELCRQNQLKFLEKHSYIRLKRECETLEWIPELVRMRSLVGDRFMAAAHERNVDAATAVLKPGNHLGLLPAWCEEGEYFYGSSYVRLLDWLDAYRANDRSVEILNPAELEQHDLSAYDALAVCRDAIAPNQTDIFFTKCNSAKVPYFMDFDDQLFMVSELESKWLSFERMIRSAAGMIVSTTALTEAFRELNPNILVKPNCLNRKLYLDSPVATLDLYNTELIRCNRRAVNVIYFGSATHASDFAIISKIIPFLKERFDVQFFLVGGCSAAERKELPWGYL